MDAAGNSKKTTIQNRIKKAPESIKMNPGASDIVTVRKSGV